VVTNSTNALKCTEVAYIVKLRYFYTFTVTEKYKRTIKGKY
jgi:hypothetical protein